MRCIPERSHELSMLSCCVVLRVLSCSNSYRAAFWHEHGLGIRLVASPDLRHEAFCNCVHMLLRLSQQVLAKRPHGHQVSPVI